jgi:hypothetical protein
VRLLPLPPPGCTINLSGFSSDREAALCDGRGQREGCNCSHQPPELYWSHWLDRHVLRRSPRFPYCPRPASSRLCFLLRYRCVPSLPPCTLRALSPADLCLLSDIHSASLSPSGDDTLVRASKGEIKGEAVLIFGTQDGHVVRLFLHHLLPTKLIIHSTASRGPHPHSRDLDRQIGSTASSSFVPRAPSQPRFHSVRSASFLLT